MIPPAKDDGVATAQEATDVIVPPDVEDDVLGAMIGSFLPHHPAVSLVDPVPTHPEIADGFAQVARQVLLPGLAVADLVTLGEAVAVGVDPARPVPVQERRPLTVGVGGREGPASVQAITRHVIAQNVPQLAIELSPAILVQEGVNDALGHGTIAQVLCKRHRFFLPLGQHRR